MKTMWSRGGFVFFGLLLGANIFGQTLTSTMTPLADAFVTSGSAGNNYGAAGGLAVSATGSPNGEFQSVMRFDLAGARSSFDSQFGAGLWSVQSVTLQVTTVSDNNPIFNSSAAGQFRVFWMGNDSWTEGTGRPSFPTTSGITYNSLQNTFIGGGDETLGTFSFDGSIGGADTYTLSLTPSFSADLLAGGGVSLRVGPAVASGASFVFNSRSFGTAANRPVLSVTAVPEPGSVALGILGLLAVISAGAGRRRK